MRLLIYLSIVTIFVPFTNSSININHFDVFNLSLVQNIDLILCGENTFEGEQGLTLKNYESFASLSAVKLCPTIDRKNWTSLHEKHRIVIMITPTNITMFIEMIDFVSYVNLYDSYVWKPFWLLAWPDLCKNQDEINNHLALLHSMDLKLKNCKINSQVFVLFYLRSNVLHVLQDTVTVFEIYGVKNRTIIEQYFPLRNLLDLEVMSNKAQRRHFHKEVITGIAMDDPKTQLMTKFEDVNGETKFKSGFAVEAFQYLAESLNFTGRAKRATEHLHRQENGSLSRLGQALISKEADILVVNSEMLEYKMNELTFLPSFYSAPLSAYFIQPPASDYRNIYLQPFSLAVWLNLVFVWLGIISFLMTFNFIKEKLQDDPFEESDDRQIAKDSVIWALTAFTQNGWHRSPETFSMKTIFLTGFFTAVLTYNSYSAVITSTLSVESDPIKDMADLKKSGIAIYSDLLLESSFNVVETIEHNELHRFSNNGSLKMDIPDVINRFIAQKPTAIVTVADFFYPPARQMLLDRDLCEIISKIKVPVPEVQGGMYIRARSSMTEHFKHRFLAFRENGVSKRNNLAFNSKSGLSCARNDEKPKKHKAFAMGDVISAFVLLFSASIVSWLALTIEKVYFWHQRKGTPKEMYALKGFQI